MQDAETFGHIAQFMTLAFFVALLACPICTAIVAHSKGRSVALWFLLGFVFGPFGLLAAIGVMPAYEDD